jgi:hypothetical protein
MKDESKQRQGDGVTRRRGEKSGGSPSPGHRVTASFHPSSFIVSFGDGQEKLK